MRIATIDVPKGCNKIFVDLENGMLTVSYGSTTNKREVFNQYTRHLEELPGIGDFAILWTEPKRKYAVVANVEDFDKSGNAIGSDGFVYRSAIKFRNYEQYLKIKGEYGENEP